jgi:putative Mg2+ transporter-C (MgtC) family protein
MDETLITFAAEWHFFLQLLLAAVLGGIVGLERQFHGRPAGLRTHILVCLGSAVIIIAFKHWHVILQGEGAQLISMDPARAAAGIITGIGFLGAGTILKGKDFVRGLTTAASIWVIAAIGITTGLGLFFLATVTTVLALFTLVVLDWVDVRSGHYGEIHVEGRGGKSFYKKTREQLANLGFSIKGYSMESKPQEDFMKLAFTVRFKERKVGFEVIKSLSELEGVKLVSWEK